MSSDTTKKLICLGSDGGDTCQLSLSERDLTEAGSVFCGLLLAHVFLSFLLRKRIKGTAGKTQTPRADMTSIEILSIGTVIVFTVYGLLIVGTWPISAKSHQSRVYAYHRTTATLNHIMLGYQSFTFVMAFVYKYLCHLDFILHHLAAICVSLISLRPLFFFYAFYFYGFVEISTIFVSMINIFKVNDELIPAYPTMYNYIRILFALCFLTFRIALWLPMCVFFWIDAVWAVKQKLNENHSPVNLIVYMFANIGFTALQMFWASKILKNLLRALAALPPRQRRSSATRLLEENSSV
eukprot:c12667_g3_i1.p1 GENE.c12667_g3_i1~~c12667_g3_i1.p1  ORF type:complete len:313 (-),score=66.01 c12667_g3_i1:108-995(-)